VTADLGLTYIYNARSQVGEIDSLAPIFQEKFVYDGFGRRVSTSLGSASTTNFLYDGLNIIAEMSQGITNAYVMNGLAPDDRFARQSGGGTRYYFTDAIGSTVALTDTTGAVQTQYTYASFGQTASSGTPSDNPYQFAGRELDPNGGYGIYYFRARYLDTMELNRFLSRDPQGLSGDYSTLYSYVGNSPLNGIDPTGQFGIFGFSGAMGGWSGDFPEAAAMQDIENGIAAAAGIGAPNTGTAGAGATNASNGSGSPDGASLDQTVASNMISDQGTYYVNPLEGYSQMYSITETVQFPTGTGPVLGAVAAAASTALTGNPNGDAFLTTLGGTGGYNLGEALEGGYGMTIGGPGGITFGPLPQP